MTVSTGSISVPGVSNSAGGQPKIHKIDVFNYQTVNLGAGEQPAHPIGARFQFGPRVFYYGRTNVSAALAPGKMVQGAAPAANYLNKPFYAAAAAGAMQVQVTLGGSAAAGLFNGGYIHINNPATCVYPWMAKIRSHAASGTVGGTSNVITLNLMDPVPVAVAVTDYATLTQAPWDRPVVVPNAALTQIPVGVPVINLPVSSTTGGTYGQGYDIYGWFQTWGPCLLLTQGTIVIANNVVIGGTSDGACGANAGTPVASAGPQQIAWGQAMRVNATGTYSLVNLTLFP